MKVLLPIDGSANCKDALEWLSNIFDCKTTEYYLVTIIKPLAELPDSFATNAVALDTLIADAQQVLKEAESTLLQKRCIVLKANYFTGYPTERIIEIAEQEDVDLIVLGSHGRHGLQKFIQGSISEYVLEHATKPVLIYRGGKARTTGQQ